MARPKSTDKRKAILDATARVIVAKGLSAPTATIAREAGIPNGSLFTYFPTKADLFNQFYFEVKTEMTAAALNGFPDEAPLHEQLKHVWSNWMQWATTNRDKRRALAQLAVSDEITPESRASIVKIMAPLFDVMERVRERGSLKNTPMSFVGAVMNSLAETTMDFMINDPANAEVHCEAGFETFWRAIS